MFDDISDDEHNRFTKRDVLDAMNMYQENYVTYSRAEVERVSGISVPPNKRNGRKQEQHIKIMNAMDDSKAVTDFKYKSDLSLAEAKKKYPEWYEKRIVRGEKKGRWHIKRDLYDWWLRKIQSGAVSVGHRYWCLSVLASYGIKCDIPEDEVLTDTLMLRSMIKK